MTDTAAEPPAKLRVELVGGKRDGDVVGIDSGESVFVAYDPQPKAGGHRLHLGVARYRDTGQVREDGTLVFQFEKPASVSLPDVRPVCHVEPGSGRPRALLPGRVVDLHLVCCYLDLGQG